MNFKMQNLRIGIRIGLALALPIAGLFALSIWLVCGYYDTSRNMGQLREMAELAPAVSSLVHEMQKERGVSAGFISSPGASGGGVFAEKLPTQYHETDAKQAELTRLLANFNAARFGGNLAARITAAQQRLGLLGAWRKAVAERAVTATALTVQYSGAIEKLIDIVEEMQLISTDTNLTRAIYAYTHLINAKEYTGVERAIGSAGFAAGQFDPASHKYLIELIDRQQSLLNEFRFFATPEQVRLLDRLFSGAEAAEAERMRRIAIESPAINGHGAGEIDSISASRWFDVMTRKIDLLKEFENHLASDLIAQASHAETAATRAALLVGALAAILLALAVWLAAAIARGIILPLERTTKSISSLASTGNAGDVEVSFEESGRGDEIGALARAAVVFKENLLKVVQAEEALKSDAILRMHHQAMGSISQGVLITDAQRRITYANTAFERISGYSEAEVLGLEPTFMYGAETDPETLEKLRAALLRGETFTCTLMNYRKDGTSFWNELSTTPVYDAQGQLTQFVGVIRDVTQERLVEQEIRIAATAFESLHGIVVTDANGTIVRVNNAFTDMTGYSAEEVVGQKPSLFKSGRHDKEFYADMWRQLLDTGGWSGEIWDRRKNGEIYPKWQTISAVKGPDGQTTHYVAAFSDTTESKEAEEQIRNLAFYDPLTGLPNRRLLMDRLQQGQAISARSRHQGALLFIDLDQFKTLNDTMGHDVGDLLLQQVSERLTGCVRDGDTVARLGGDEFVVMLEELSENPEEAAAQARVAGENILAALNQPYQLAGNEHHSTPSIGVTLYCGHEITIDEMLKRADLAMYQSKASGRNAMHFFDPQMQAVISNRVALEKEMRLALQRREFLLYYQAQVCGDGCIMGAEALIRWQQPERGMVSPAAFIPLAEDTGLILPLGQWVLETACAQLAAWGVQPGMDHLTLAVNVSARQFKHPSFVEQVLAALAQTKANPHRLKLELTEGMLLDDVEAVIAKMNALKEHGVTFSLDDFGTGYSSLSYLKRLPLYQLKIDQSFVRDVLTDPNDAAIAQTIVTLAHSMGLSVIAEGVETEAQREFLDHSGCRAFQGYLFSKPVPVKDFEQLVERCIQQPSGEQDCGCGLDAGVGI
jgi:diguanylate cyclase (GGDEF)-like protein/PAS domain S-box-containing protein